MKYTLLPLISLLFLSAFLILNIQGAHAQQNTLDTMKQKFQNFTQETAQKLKSMGEKVEGMIHNATSETNETAKNVTQGGISNNTHNTNST